jgi:uncharacterized membrane protein YbhN (UPF0104 family)
VDSLSGLFDAIEAFFDSIASVNFGALLLGVAFHLGNLALRTRAWTNILQSAYPRAQVRWRDVGGAYVAGVGVNGFVPARGGDVVKLFLVHSRIRGAAYPTLGSSLLAETLFDSAIGFVLLIWAWQIGVADGLPGSGLFEFSWATSHPQIFFTVLIIIAGLVAAALIIYGHRVRAFWERVKQGLAILKDRRTYLRTVAALQAGGWVCRLLSAIAFLRAFHVDATVRNGLLVLVIGSLATGMPLTPGGLGPKQALTVAVLSSQGSQTKLLAFSVGMELTLLLVNLLLAIISVRLMLKGVRLRDLVSHAKEQRAAGNQDQNLGDLDDFTTRREVVPRDD